MVFAAESLQESQQRLEKIKARLEEASRDLRQKEQAERNLLGDLRAVEEELIGLERRRETLVARMAEIETEVETQRRASAKARGRVEEVEGRVHRRLSALYRTGGWGPLKALFSSLTPAELAHQYSYLTRIVRHDRELLDDYRGRLAALHRAVAALEALQNRQAGLLVEVQGNHATLVEGRRLKEKLLVRVKQDKGALAALVRELTEKAERMAALLKKLESARTAEYIDTGTLFGRQKGRLPWPLAGPVVVGFGSQRHPQLGTLYESNGIEIGVSGEKPVTPLWDGRVVFASWFKGYGNLLILDHGDSYHTLYAHASRLTRKVGDQVKKGEVVAYSGFPGTGGLYLEIRHRGSPVDPLAWLGAPPGANDRRN